MVTVAELGRAAALFEDTAAMVAVLAASADGIDTSSILLGGSLAQQVPDRIAETAAIAHRCRAEIEAAAATCHQRAIELADYHQDLVAYHVAFAEYVYAKGSWDRRYMTWLMDRSYLLPHPGPQPVAPVAPVAPAWLE